MLYAFCPPVLPCGIFMHCDPSDLLSAEGADRPSQPDGACSLLRDLVTITHGGHSCS